VIQTVRTSDVATFDVQGAKLGLRVRRKVVAGMVLAPAAIAAQGADESAFHRVTSPLTGVFYRSASPDQPAYVKEGDAVTADTVIGLIETMKIFNEVTADKAGRIVRFAAENGHLVHSDDLLMVIDPGANA
jgi:acetyl-CoA carboxylase biotin carboxyl carrier protein